MVKLEQGYGQWPTLYITVADLGEELGRPRLLSYSQTKLRQLPKGRKNFFGDRAPPPLSQGLDDWVLPPYLKVWIRHCIIIQLLLTCASKAFASLVIFVEGKFTVFPVSKSLISFVLLQRMKQNINYQKTQFKNGLLLFNTGVLSFFGCLSFCTRFFCV